MMTDCPGILPQPMQPDDSRSCPRCGERRALQVIATREHEICGRITVYRCSKCHAEIEYAQRHPPHAV
jgi:DNA-directed RNA polymerase subunit RPC12/RpoP